MAVIKLTALGGLYPSLLPRNLPDGGAQVAQNVNSVTSEFRPLGQDTTVFTQLGTASLTAANPKSLYRQDKTSGGQLNTNDSTGWLSSSTFRSTVKTQLNNDLLGRIYISEEAGASRPTVLSIDNSVRILGLPAPATAPAVEYVEQYTFSPEQRDIEVAAVLQEAIQVTRTEGVTRVLVGLGDQVPAVGWVRQSAFSSAEYAEKIVLRVFAVNPSTNAIIDTYGAMPITESSWVFDPALGGFSATASAGTLPSWAAGHTKWWCVPLKGFAEAFDVNDAALQDALEDLPMPGKQGTEKLLTSAEATTFVERISDLADKDKPAVKTHIDDLIQKQSIVADVFNRGSAAFLNKAIQDFYSASPVNSSIESAKEAYALKIWRYVEMIGQATATPFYIESTGA
jgi:hypothetical protein